VAVVAKAWRRSGTAGQIEGSHAPLLLLHDEDDAAISIEEADGAHAVSPARPSGSCVNRGAETTT
jgi:hypothetical protein